MGIYIGLQLRTDIDHISTRTSINDEDRVALVYGILVQFLM
jgi:hypothetical protein